MAKIGVGLVTSILMVIIILIVIFTVIADTSSDVGSAAGNVSVANATGTGDNVPAVFPLTSFFKRKGVILLAFIAGVLIIIIKGLLPSGK